MDEVELIAGWWRLAGARGQAMEKIGLTLPNGSVVELPVSEEMSRDGYGRIYYDEVYGDGGAEMVTQAFEAMMQAALQSPHVLEAYRRVIDESLKQHQQCPRL